MSSELLTTIETAKYLGVTVQTLAQWRMRGIPAIPYMKIGRLVRYARHDLEAWLTTTTHHPQAEALTNGMENDTGRTEETCPTAQVATDTKREGVMSA